MNKADQLQALLNGNNLWLFEDLVTNHSQCATCSKPLQFVQVENKVQVRCHNERVMHYNDDCIRDNVLHTMIAYRRNAGFKSGGSRAGQARRVNMRKKVEFVDTQGNSVHVVAR